MRRVRAMATGRTLLPRRGAKASVVALSLLVAPAVPCAQPVDAGVATTPSTADEARRERAARAWSEGEEAYGRGDYVRAAERFRAAYEALPAPEPLYNMGRAHELGGEVALAIAAYEQYLREAPRAPNVLLVRDRLDALRLRPTEVFVASEPVGAQVHVDDQTAPAEQRTPVVLRLTPGPHVLQLDREGYRTAIRRIVLQPGRQQTLAVSLEGLPVAPRPPDALARIRQRRGDRPLSYRLALLLGWSVIDALRNQFPASLGLEGTLFVGRSLAGQLHFSGAGIDGLTLLATAEAGWVFVVDDFDLGFFLNGGVVHNTQPEPVGGATLRLDAVLGQHLGLGIFIRATWRHLRFNENDALIFGGGSFSFFL